jgi:predicted metal-binding membrane protein
MTPDSGSLGASLRHDRVIVAGLLLFVAALAWAFTAHQAMLMEEMEAAMWRDMNMSMNGMEPSWTAVDALIVFVMWSAMMAAMMLPGASPMVSAFATINRRRLQRGAPYVPIAVFLLGYLIVRVGFSLIATALQWALQAAGLLTTMMQSASYYWSTALFFAAGVYQFSPLKKACRTYCRTPDSFTLSEWRDGDLGAMVMGMWHGLFCTGCCAALMLLLFAIAVMDLRWVAALTVLVTVEKLLPGHCSGVSRLASACWPPASALCSRDGERPDPAPLTSAPCNACREPRKQRSGQR